MFRTLSSLGAVALMTGAAAAADLPVREAPPPVFAAAPIFTWTGFYAGTHTAYTMTDKQTIRTSGISPGNIENVAIGARPARIKNENDLFSKIGGGFGYNWQLSPGSGIVIGTAFDITWTDIHKNSFIVGTGGNPSHFFQSLNYLGTLNGKVGYAFDRWFVYGTAGLAFGSVDYAANFYNPALQLGFQGADTGLFKTGFNYGGGVEWAIPQDSFLNFLSVGRYLGITGTPTFKAEYIRYDLGTTNLLVASVGGPGAGYVSKFRTEGSMVRFGFNYKFGSN